MFANNAAAAPRAWREEEEDEEEDGSTAVVVVVETSKQSRQHKTEKGVITATHIYELMTLKAVTPRRRLWPVSNV